MKPRGSSPFIALLSLFLTMIAPAVRGQNDAGIWDVPRSGGESITEPSPEATAMRRYQDYPVSYATGTADISIPLLDLPGGAVNVSLGLSYHTGGIKHDALNYGVGLGWALIGLGCVSRQICGFPDEWKGYANDVRNDVQEHSQDVDYYISIIEKKTDAEYDRYSYNFPGYSGSFYIKNGSIVELGRSDVVIERIASADNALETDAFVITTPEGAVYTFDVKESINYQYVPHPLSIPYYNANYSCTASWQLYSIKGLENQDSISISYKRAPSWTRNHDAILRSLSYLDSTVAQECGWLSGPDDGIGATNRTEFESPAIPDKITSRCGTIVLSHTTLAANAVEGPRSVLATAELKDLNGTLIKKVTLDVDRLLKTVTISIDNVVVNKYSFRYNNKDSSGGYDLFGYRNGARNLSPWVSVLDDQLELSPQRLSDATAVKSEILTGITDITGLETYLTYEPAVVSNPDRPQWSIFPEEVQIGVRISEIKVTDPVTKRNRVRKFSYRGARCSHDLWKLTYNDYLSLSGTIKTEPYIYQSMYMVTRRTHGATYLASAATRGIPTESAVIYYTEVDETIEGTGLEQPFKTTYQYKVDKCLHPYHTAGGMTGYTGIDGNKRHLGIQTIAFPSNEFFVKAMSPHPTTGYHQESIGFRPELESKKEYEWRDGEYRLTNEELYYYSCPDSVRHCLGVFCESNVLKVVNYVNGLHSHDITTLNDVNYYPVYVTSGHLQCDSVIVRRHFPDGNTRTIRTVNLYKGILIPEFLPFPLSQSNAATTAIIKPLEGKYILPGFYCDSIASLSSKASLYPLGSYTSMRDESIATYRAMSEYTGGSIKIAGCTLRRLPVVEKYVLKSDNDADSILRRYEYGRFNCGGNTLTRPTRVFIQTDGGEENSRATVFSQSYTSYDSRGRIATMTDNTGKKISAVWDTYYDALSKISYPILSLSTNYTSKPLTGYTKIIEPSGRVRNYTYEAGRLIGETNHQNKQMASYTYKLYGDGTATGSDRANRFTTTIHDDSGSATETVYYDGFGLPVQTISTVAGGNLTATTVKYDALGRPVTTYLPVPVNSDDFASNFAKLGVSHYGDNYPFSSVSYRATGGDQPVEVIREGAAMREHPARTVYRCNSATDTRYKCRRYRLGASASSETVTLSGDWPAGELDVTEQTDPDGHVIVTFTDWRGLKMLERRVVSGTTYADTYFLYDVRGQLRVVLQPEGVANMTAVNSSWTNDNTYISNYAFVYRYDRRGNCIYSKIPGADATLFRYDVYNRLAFRQTPAMDETGEAEFYLYDTIGRQVMTGLTTSSLPTEDSYQSMTTAFQTGGQGIDGTGYVAPAGVTLDNPVPTVVNYYDSYACATMTGFVSLPADKKFLSPNTVKGRLAGSRVAVLTGNSGSNVTVSDAAGSLYSLYGYDPEGNVISLTETAPMPDSYVKTTSSYTRLGKPLDIVTEITTIDSLYRVSHPHTYDNAGFLKSEWVSVGKVRKVNPGTLYSVSLYNNYEYDNIGRLKQEYHNSNTSTEYSYNLRGELGQIITPAFRQLIYYDNGTNPCYNGNTGNMKISYMGGYDIKRSFSYDLMDRLTSMTSSDGYNTTYTYNLNSSPLTIQRYGRISSGKIKLIDNLSIDYTGNRLNEIFDYADNVVDENSSDFPIRHAAYRYDKAGRLIIDTARGIMSVSYNHMDRPGCVEFSDGNCVTYAYSATGRKLMTAYTRQLPSGERTDYRYYCDGAEFVKNGAGALGIGRYNTAWGYVDGRGGLFVKMRDYQGNIRAIVSSSGTVVQTTDYYPYGMPMATSTGAEVNRYKYGGKEFETEDGLNQYDFEARTQLPQLGLFTMPDPKAGEYTSLNPYLYCAANPIKYIDPTGLAWQPIIDDDLHLTGFEWVDPADSYDESGNLLEGLYEQAIFFSNTGVNGKSYNPNSGYNIGTSIATVYKSDGSTETFDACTYPSNLDKFPTIPEGLYEGVVGLHKGTYRAIRMSDIGTIDFSNSSIELGFENPSKSYSTTKAKGINIHRAGVKNYTGPIEDNHGVSEGCFLIDRNNYDNFIMSFKNAHKIAIMNSRSFSHPVSPNRTLQRSVDVRPLKF